MREYLHNGIERAKAGLKRTFCTKEGLRKAGCYGALALLLVMLGVASYAYRERGSRAREAQPRAVAAVQTPRPTPEPTPEPILWVWPLVGEVVGEYAPDEPVWSATLSQWQTHPALDIAGSPGEAVYACREGTVLDAWNDRLWGNVIVLSHPEGYQSTYAGVNTLKLVSPGDTVEAGQVISAVGQSALEADLSWHLHFELTRDGEPVDFAALVDGGR